MGVDTGPAGQGADGVSGELAQRLEAYVATRIPAAKRPRVEALERIHGGASRETYRFRLSLGTGSREHQRALILRRDPPGSCIETDRRHEFEAYRAFADERLGVPVPEMLWLEEDAHWLDHPFFVMEEIVGFEASPVAIVQPPYAEHAAGYGREKYAILGRIARADPEGIGLVAHFDTPAPAECWQRELGRWEAVLDEDEPGPQPVIRAAVRWLRAHPPPPPHRVGVVHGDYRTGNFLYDRQGGIHGILDWEMAHLGDPLEDLAWGFSPLFDFQDSGLAGGLLAREEAVRIWQESSRLEVDPSALRWWEVFSAVKGQAIWLSSGKEFLEGENPDPILAMASLAMVDKQDRAALLALGRLS